MQTRTPKRNDPAFNLVRQIDGRISAYFGSGLYIEWAGDAKSTAYRKSELTWDPGRKAWTVVQ